MGDFPRFEWIDPVVGYCRDSGGHQLPDDVAKLA